MAPLPSSWVGFAVVSNVVSMPMLRNASARITARSEQHNNHRRRVDSDSGACPLQTALVNNRGDYPSPCAILLDAFDNAWH
jgi:hypothetical protein